MGFSSEAASINMPVGSKWTVPVGTNAANAANNATKRQDSGGSEGSVLATDNAPLSDDEYEGVESVIAELEEAKDAKKGGGAGGVRGGKGAKRAKAEEKSDIG